MALKKSAAAADHQLDEVIMAAIKCGPIPVIRDTTGIPAAQLTTGEKVIRFAERFMLVPDGPLRGEPLKLLDFQKAFLLAVLDNDVHVRTAVMSVARRNGKSFLMAILLAAALVGPLKIQNSTIASAANSRDQAALIYRLLKLSLQASPELAPLLRFVDTPKRIINVKDQIEYKSLSADAGTQLGLSLAMVVHDEVGIIKSASSDFISMLTTSLGSYRSGRYFAISTQAATDQAYLSQLIDRSQATQPRDTVVHCYESPEHMDPLDPVGMRMANPGVGVFRDEAGLRAELEAALRLPESRARQENLLINRRTSQSNVLVAPSVWRELGGTIDMSIFSDGRPVALGIDLSARFDLTAAVLAAQDNEGVTCLWPFIFVPQDELDERGRRDGADYAAWVRAGHMHGVEGNSMDYSKIASTLDRELQRLGCRPTSIEFDRWGMSLFQQAIEFVGASFADNAEWNAIGQGWKDITPRLQHLQGLMLDGKIRHPMNPALNLAFTNAIVIGDSSGNTKLDKAVSSGRIDAAQASLMAAFGVRAEAPRAVSSYLDDPDSGGLMFI